MIQDVLKDHQDDVNTQAKRTNNPKCACAYVKQVWVDKLITSGWDGPPALEDNILVVLCRQQIRRSRGGVWGLWLLILLVIRRLRLSLCLHLGICSRVVALLFVGHLYSVSVVSQHISGLVLTFFSL